MKRELSAPERSELLVHKYVVTFVIDFVFASGREERRRFVFMIEGKAREGASA